MAPTLYMVHASPPCRAVLMTAAAIGLKLEEKEISFFKNEHLEPHFNKINPQHTIPTLIDDDGFAFWDSHAIMTYLISQYGKDDSLYPKDPKKRAVINQRLFFESGAVFFHMRNIAKSILNKGDNFIDPEEEERMVEAYGFLEKFLEGLRWVAGDFLSIADYSLVSTVSSANGVIPVDFQVFPNVFNWLERCEDLPEYKTSRKGLRESNHMLRIRLAKK